jgi:3-oxoacyl-(acyl-carrier-protein) synthase
LGHQVDAFWANLIAGQCGIAKIARFDASRFDCQIAAEVKDFDPLPALPSPKEIRRTDRFAQFGVHAGWQALRDSGLDLNRVNRDEIGVFIGSGIGGLQTVSEQCTVLLERGPDRLSAFMIPMLILNMARVCSRCITSCGGRISRPAPRAPRPTTRWARLGAPSRWAMLRSSSPAALRRRSSPLASAASVP